MNHDPISGPIPRNEFKELVKAAHGVALRTIRKYDPLFGREPGEKIKWKVRVRSDMEGVAYVSAANEKEAMALACDLTSAEVDWEDYSDDFEVLDIKAADILDP